MLIVPSPTATLHAFDHHAGEYAVWEDHPTAQSWRARGIARCVDSFPPGSRVLDVGGGTGVDAEALAALGYEVTVVEPSSGMAAAARSKGVCVAMGRAEDLLGMDELGAFDGAISNFGALNCLDGEGLRAFGEGLEARLRPGAAAILVVMGPVCLSETVVLLARGRPIALLRRRNFFSRLGGSRGGSDIALGEGTVRVNWWTPRDLVRALPGFELLAVEALGAVVPAPDLHRGRPWSRRLDARVGRIPGLRQLGDHTLCMFRKRAENLR